MEKDIDFYIKFFKSNLDKNFFLNWWEENKELSICVETYKFIDHKDNDCYTIIDKRFKKSFIYSEIDEKSYGFPEFDIIQSKKKRYLALKMLSLCDIVDLYKTYLKNQIKQINERNKIGVLFVFIKNNPNHIDKRKRKTNDTEENPLNILPKELIHLILSYSHPWAPQKKYCRE